MEFLATWHGKNACDRVGGSIKRLAAHANLQRLFSNQILTPKKLFVFAEASVDSVTLVFVSSLEVVTNTGFLELQFATSSTFKGTQSHQFIPSSSSLSLTMKKTSYATHSKKVSLTEGGSSKVQMTVEDMKPGKFYVCQYDNNWYFCFTNYLSSEHGDVNMKFLHPKGLSEKFFWPQHDDECWILIKDVYCEVAAPSTSSTGWFYCFEKKTKENIESYFN